MYAKIFVDVVLILTSQIHSLDCESADNQIEREKIFPGDPIPMSSSSLHEATILTQRDGHDFKNDYVRGALVA